MKGTDCTPEQIAAAELFVTRIAAKEFARNGDTVTVKKADLIRLVAWYGALRYIACRDDEGGSLDEPGEFIVNGKALHEQEG